MREKTIFESNLNKFCCHCLIHIHLNMHKNNSHEYSHIFVGIHDWLRGIRCDLKVSTKRKNINDTDRNEKQIWSKKKISLVT